MNKPLDTPLRALMHAASVLQDRMERACEEAGITSAKFGPLFVLLQAGGTLPLGELADRVKCVRSNMTQLVDRLEADGLVRRTNDPDDRRVVRAELTPIGEERAKDAKKRLDRIHEEFSATLSDSDRLAIERIVATLA